MSKSKILVSQLGARHRYLIPYLLYKNDLLGKLYTDSSKYSLIGKIAAILSKFFNVGGQLNRLVNRNPLIPAANVNSVDRLLFLNFLHREQKKNKYEIMYQSLSSTYIKQGTNSCNILYNMFFENIEFVKHCKLSGLTIVVDIYENPNGYNLLENELVAHPEYQHFNELKKDYKEKKLFREKYVEQILELADYYTIPSVYVEKSLSVYRNFDSRKSHIIPYPSSIQVNAYNYRPKKHQIVWVGNDPIRKGLIYCAKAATILKKTYPDLVFLIVGHVSNLIIENPTFKDLHFMGVCNKSELIEIFETSEAYVFPTLFEGFAGTIIEAASCGCPIITTENSGVDVDHFSAIFISEKDTDAIVNAVISVFNDSNYRDEISRKTYEYSSNLSLEKYEEKLIRFFDNIK